MSISDFDPYSMYFNRAKHDHQGEKGIDWRTNDSSGPHIYEPGKCDSSCKPYQGELVEAPPHYTTGGIETIDYIEAKLSRPHEYEGYLRGNVIKYLSRYEAKAGVKDLEKALKYLGWLIDHLNGQASENRQ